MLDRQEPPPSWKTCLKEPDIVTGQVILLVIVALTSMQVVARYVFNSPFNWPEELSTILLVWMTFIGATALTRRNDHIRVELIGEIFGPGAERWFDVVFDIATLVFLGFIAYGGWQLIGQLSFERTPALRLPLSVEVAIVPASAVLMMLYYAIAVVRNVSKLLRTRPTHGD